MVTGSLDEIASDSLQASDSSAGTSYSANEAGYLGSMMPEVRQESYTCVSGCSSCASCDGND